MLLWESVMVSATSRNPTTEWDTDPHCSQTTFSGSPVWFLHGTPIRVWIASLCIFPQVEGYLLWKAIFFFKSVDNSINLKPLALKEFGLILIIQALETQKCFITNYYLWFRKSILKVSASFLSLPFFHSIHTWGHTPPPNTHRHTQIHIHRHTPPYKHTHLAHSLIAAWMGGRGREEMEYWGNISKYRFPHLWRTTHSYNWGFSKGSPGDV